MLELRDVSVSRGNAEAAAWLLRQISVQIPRGHLCAIVGPSGCGKTTLLKLIAGIQSCTSGAIFWEGRDLEQHDLEPHEIGYVPQFSIAFDLLTVSENIDAAIRLRVGGLTEDQRAQRRTAVLADVGLAAIADRRVGVLSGGQKRRLALALEMVSEPLLLLCDEVTSGLDQKSQTEVLHLLRDLARRNDRTVISVTHSLEGIGEHDSVIILYEGRLVFHGAPALLPHYFELENPALLFTALARRPSQEWAKLWREHSAGYTVNAERRSSARTAAVSTFRAPHFLTQLGTLLHRRGRIFLRARGQFALQLALLFGFPCLVVIFAWDGLPQIQNLAGSSSNAVQQLIESAQFSLQSSRVASLVSGLVMFQVVLLALMGSNNGAREIAGERAIFEKEKFAGLRPSSYLASKAIFLAALVLAQSIWMTVFINLICRFPGDLLSQIAILCLANGALTAVCLAISSLTRSAENASLVSVYLVGFQLPLSGAVLALPRSIGFVTRPFIAAFWGWSGYLQSMRDTRFYDVVQTMSQTPLAAIEVCGWVLAVHIAAGLFVAYLGVSASRWD